MARSIPITRTPVAIGSRRSGVAHPPGPEEAPATAHHVMAGHTGRLVDDDKTRVHSAIAVSTKSRSTDHRPVSALNGGPESVVSVDQNRRFERPARAGVVDGEDDVRVFEAEPSLGQREPRLVGCLLGAEQDSIPVDA